MSIYYSRHLAHIKILLCDHEDLLDDFNFLLPLRPSSAAATAAVQSSSRYSTAADALAALVDAAASAPQIDVAKVKENKHEREDDMSVRRAATISDHQQQEAERRSMQSPYGGMSLPTGKPHAPYSEGPATKEKAPQTSKSRIEEELRTRGKTTITAANFIDVIITRQIASDKDSRERGSQSSDSSSSCECLINTIKKHFLSVKICVM